MIRIYFLSPLSFFYGLIIKIRNQFYELSVFRKISVPCPVISVGNLTLGGTGKTPVVDLLLKWFEKNQKRVLVLSRGYGRDSRGVQKVKPNQMGAAQVYGDEPVLLALQNPQAMVYVAEKRWAHAQEIFDLEKPQVMILDDGFQHRGIARDLDIVVLDATVGPYEYELIPGGRAREPLSSLNRAQLVVLTKTNLVSKARLEYVRALVPSHISIVEVSYELEGFSSLDRKHFRTSSEMGTVLAVSAIGNPSGFSETLQKAGVQVRSTLAFRDHHYFSEQDLKKIQKQKENCGALSVVVTEKDAVKIKNGDSSIWVARLKLVIENGDDNLSDRSTDKATDRSSGKSTDTLSGKSTDKLSDKLNECLNKTVR